MATVCISARRSPPRVEEMAGDTSWENRSKDEMCIKIYIEIVKQNKDMYWWYEIFIRYEQIYIKYRWTCSDDYGKEL